MEELQAQTTSEKEWWEKKRASIQSNFMKELDEGPKSPQRGSDDDAVLVEAGGPAVGQQGSAKKKKKAKN